MRGESSEKTEREGFRDEGSDKRVMDVREHSCKEETAWDRVKSVNEERSGKKGRGVKEGTWI